MKVLRVFGSCLSCRNGVDAYKGSGVSTFTSFRHDVSVLHIFQKAS